MRSASYFKKAIIFQPGFANVGKTSNIHPPHFNFPSKTIFAEGHVAEVAGNLINVHFSPTKLNIPAPWDQEKALPRLGKHSKFSFLVARPGQSFTIPLQGIFASLNVAFSGKFMVIPYYLQGGKSKSILASRGISLMNRSEAHQVQVHCKGVSKIW